MFGEKINYTPEELYNYNFKFDTTGYRAREVDKVLDDIIEDEKQYIRAIKKMEKYITELTDENARLKQELRKVKTELDEKDLSEPTGAVNNVDLLKRISQLEKVVYSKFE